MIDPTALRTLCEQATPGPWYTGTLDAHIVFDRDYILTEGSLQGPNRHNAERNAAFIAAARETLPQLLDENAALRRELEETRKATGSAYGTSWSAEIGDIEMALRQVCTYSDVDPESGEECFEYLVETERGDAVVEAHSRVEAIKQILAQWDALAVERDALESRLAALTAAGEKVVKHIEHYGSVRWDGHALDAFKALLRSDP